jgi:hypothetical protein
MIGCHSHVVHEYCGPCACDSAAAAQIPAVPVFGFDVGGVLVPAATSGDEDTLLGNNVSNVVPELGALETLAKLVDRFGPNCVHICSKVIFALFFVDFG